MPKPIGPMPAMLQTLQGATKHYRLRNPSISNGVIAETLGIENETADFVGVPGCCFYYNGYLCAIRTRQDEVAVFHLFGSTQVAMKNFADQIIAEEPEETHA